MKVLTVDLNADHAEALREAVLVLRAGGVIVYPTDTSYSLGANALDFTAVDRVFRIKKRSSMNPLPIVVKNMVWAHGLAYISPTNEQRLSKVWPGKVTVVLPKRDIIPSVLVAGRRDVGMRIAEHPFVDELLGKFGYPLTNTPANTSANEATRDVQAVLEVLASADVRPDLVLDAGMLPESAPATVMDMTSEQPKILRIGAAKPQQLLELLQM